MIPWGIIAGGAGLGASALGSMFDETTPGSHNAQWLQNPQYGYTEGNMKYLSDYYNQGLQGLQQGKAPQWYQRYEQAQKPRQRQDLYQTYYGGNWGPGIMDTLKSYNVQRGTPAGQQGTLYGKQLSDYATQSQKIDEYFNTMGANAMQQSENTYLQGMRQLPEGPSGQWDIWDTQGSYNPSWLTKMGQGLSSFAPYANEMMGDWNPFAKKKTAGQTFDPNAFFNSIQPAETPITQTSGYNSPMSFNDLTSQFLGPSFGSATEGLGTSPSYATDGMFPYSTAGTRSDMMSRGPSFWDQLQQTMAGNRASWAGTDTSSPWMPSTPSTGGWPSWTADYYKTVTGSNSGLEGMGAPDLNGVTNMQDFLKKWRGY